MKYLLDTNVVIAAIAGEPAITSRLKEQDVSDFGVSSVVMHELYSGAFRSVRVEANIARVEALRFPVLDLSKRDGRHAGELRADLARKGTPIGPYDVLIAGQALARSLTLVTRNVAEFVRVDGLVVESWQ
ncbi:MAG: type II toxin-antitoxin system VapC family toxin [Boseongicola sp. SB0662_bin_57]|nr:type II toxin-antitoxin system VapC family toxin [Boseongicola sp. SB0662_bin_57]